MTRPLPVTPAALLVAELRALDAPSPRCALPWCLRAPVVGDHCQLCAARMRAALPATGSR